MRVTIENHFATKISPGDPPGRSWCIRRICAMRITSEPWVQATPSGGLRLRDLFGNFSIPGSGPQPSNPRTLPNVSDPHQ